MCGVFFSNVSDLHASLMGSAIRHRGLDSQDIRSFRGVHLGLNRLAIVDREIDSAIQPYETGASLIAFNGEIYNHDKIGGRSEIASIEHVMRHYPNNFERFLDGYYAIVRVDKARERVIVSRDPIGVVPLYYAVFAEQFFISSEIKGLSVHKRKVKEVKPGETIVFDFQGRIKKRRRYDPISLHQEPLHLSHLKWLFERAVARRVSHADDTINVTIALSGGLDSAMVLCAADRMENRGPLDAITITMDETDPHVERCKKLCALYGVPLKVVVLDVEMIKRHWPIIRFALEDPHPNVIKYAAMIRNYFVAMHARGTVILCGEGADELDGGYPSHAGLSGLALSWKCYSTLRSMHAINLDRVNKGGMMHTKEYRVPFLDRSLVQYMMGIEKQDPGKRTLRRLAMTLGVPSFILQQDKYNIDDTRFRELAKTLLTIDAFHRIGAPGTAVPAP
jgi:asparagine synthase (glutamine-hydrolysing)